MKKHYLLKLGLLILVSCAKEKTEKTANSELENLFTKEFFLENEPGGSIIVKKGDQTIFSKSYGISDINSKEKNNENTIYNTGSISKTFVSNAILILHERKQLDINDNISKYFPDFKNKSIPEEIKIKHFLSHTSGIPDARDVYNNQKFYLTAKDTANFEPLKKVDSLLFQPGEKFTYSNPAYNGLALIIESVTKRPWQEFVNENIFKPCGMSHSKITNGSLPDSDVAHGYYEGRKGIFQEYDYGEVPTFAAAGNGGIWCSVLDLVKYENAIQNNVFLGKELTKESRTIFSPENWKSDEAPGIGYSWFIGDTLNYKHIEVKTKYVMHTGSQGGFRAFHVYLPEHDITYIGLFNRPLKHYSYLLNKGVQIFEEYNWLN